MKFIDLSNQHFGRLVAKSLLPNKRGGKFIWECLCICGNTVYVFSCNLRKGHTQSCGCLRKEKTILRKTTHGFSKTSTYYTWVNMFTRCTNKNSKDFSEYAGRGINICQRWHKFENFIADMGEKPNGKSLDRINNNKGYYKNNCRWATPKEQANNRRPRRRKPDGITR